MFTSRLQKYNENKVQDYMRIFTFILFVWVQSLLLIDMTFM